MTDRLTDADLDVVWFAIAITVVVVNAAVVAAMAMREYNRRRRERGLKPARALLASDQSQGERP